MATPNEWHPWSSREQVKHHLLSTGDSTTTPEQFIAESNRSRATFDQEAAERDRQSLLVSQRDQILEAYDNGTISSLKGAALELANAGMHELAEMVVGAGRVLDDESMFEDAALFDTVEDMDWRQLNETVQSTKLSAAQQAEADAQAEANRRGQDLLQIGAEAARAYATQGLADTAARIVAGKLVSGEASPTTEAEMVQLVNDGARVAAVDTTRLRQVDEELEASFRAHTKGFGGRNLPYQTQSELDVYRDQWLTRNRPGVLAKYAPSDADYAPGPTAEDLRDEQIARVENRVDQKSALSPDAFQRAKQLEAERNSRRGGLDSSWDQARGIKTASPALAAELGDVAEVVSDR